MSTMAVASGAMESTLNPNAPLFIPAALQQVEEFSPEWYGLVKSSAWFREHWFRQHEEEVYDDTYEEEDINLLPETIDLGIDDDVSYLDGLDDYAAYQAFTSVDHTLSAAQHDKLKGVGGDADVLLKTLNLKSSNNIGIRNILELPKYREKPLPAVSPKPSPRRIIQQPR